MADPLKQIEKNWSYAQYLTWDDNNRWEIINGTVYNMSPAPGRFHQHYIGNIFAQFHQQLKGKPCQAFVSPFDVRFAEKPDDGDEDIINVVQPDIIIVCDQSKLDNRGCKGAPDLVVEVLSPSTMKRDRKEKFELYRKFGVKEYWLVYPGENTIEVFTLNNGSYGESVLYDENDTVTVSVAGGFNVVVKEVFEN